MDKEKYIEIRGAHANNLKGVDVDIPRGRFTVITGISGSGKSSLAFDTIYAEGQRRYMNTLSPYAKHFMGILEKPSVESISGLSPVIAIEQKTTGSNPRSTVGTITEIYDFLRLLYARASVAYSPLTGKELVRYTDSQIVDLIMSGYHGRKCLLLAPLVRGRKGHYRELFDQLRRKGFTSVRIDGEMRDLSEVGTETRNGCAVRWASLFPPEKAPLRSWTWKAGRCVISRSIWSIRTADFLFRSPRRTLSPSIPRRATARTARGSEPWWM